MTQSGAYAIDMSGRQHIGRQVKAIAFKCLNFKVLMFLDPYLQFCTGLLLVPISFFAICG